MFFIVISNLLAHSDLLYCRRFGIRAVRAESMLLKSKIEAEMPCLTAEMILRTTREAAGTVSVGSDATLLDGQISSWTIRLSNTGNAPASNVSLKTNLPWVHLVTSCAAILCASPLLAASS